jgi:hypothetical protein
MKKTMFMLALFAIVSGVMALTVSVDIEYQNYGITYIGQGAAPAEGDYWNTGRNWWWDGILNTSSGENLLADDGQTVTKVGYEITGRYDWNVGTIDNEMFRDGLITEGIGSNVEIGDIKITGLISGVSYDLFLYPHTTWGSTYTFEDVSKEASGDLFWYEESGEFTEGDDHVKFTVVADENGEIIGTYSEYDGLGRGSICGLQIVLPEVITIESDADLTVYEEGQTSVDFTVVLGQEPTSDVTFTVLGSDRFAIDVEELVFTPSDWSAKTVVVSAVDNDTPEGLVVETVGFDIASEDALFDGATVPGVDITIVDNDKGMLVSVSEIELDEDQAEIENAQSFGVKLSLPPEGDVIVSLDYDTEQFTVDFDAEFSGTQNDLTFTPENWDDEQMIYAVAIDDDLVEGFPGVDRDGDGEGPLGIELSEAGWSEYTLSLNASSSDAEYQGNSSVLPVFIMDNEDFCRGRYGSAGIMIMDTNADCYIDLGDFVVIAEYWLACNDPANAECELPDTISPGGEWFPILMTNGK